MGVSLLLPSCRLSEFVSFVTSRDGDAVFNFWVYDKLLLGSCVAFLP